MPKFGKKLFRWPSDMNRNTGTIDMLRSEYFKKT